MKPQVGWKQFDATDYKNAADSFGRVSCSSKERGKYAFYEGLAWKKVGNYDKALGAFYRVIRRYPKEREPQTGMLWAPLAFAEYAAYAAQEGHPEDILRLKEKYGEKNYRSHRVRWIQSRPAGKDEETERVFSILPAETSLHNLVTFYLAKAYSIKGDTGKMKETLEPAVAELYGTMTVQGKTSFLHREAQRLLLRHDVPFTRFMNSFWGAFLFAGITVGLGIFILFRKRP